jgi:RND family efflux transporter MFP subunit
MMNKMSIKKLGIHITGLTAFLLIHAILACQDSSTGNEAMVKRGDIDLIVAAKGKVEAVEDVDLAPKTLGRVKEIYVREGDFVNKDDVIAVLENEELKAQVQQAKANISRAQAELKETNQNLERLSELFQRGIISKSELDSATMKYDVSLSQLKKAQADLSYAEALLENTHIRAPFSGKIVKRYLDPGETITLEKLVPIVTIADVTKILVKAEIDETDIRKINLGQRAIVTADAYPGEEFKGKITEISPTLQRKTVLSDNPAEMVDTKVLETTIELDSGERLNLGLKVDVTILADNREDVLIVPLKAVRHQDGMPFVKVKKEGNYQEKRITIGSYDDENIEVIEGLEEGDTVLLQNSSGL